MTVLTIKLIKPHPAQAQIINHPARFKVVSCGRRFGKTELLKDLIINPALETRGEYGVFMPTYKMLREFWDSLKNTLAPVVSKVSEQEKRLELITGSVIDGWSLDSADSIRGRKYRRVVIDEAAMIPNLQYAWENVVFPTLTDYAGSAIFASTPKGRGYFYQLYQLGLDPLKPDWQAFTFPTSSNPRISPDELAIARDTIPALAWQQEYEAQFVEDGAMVFRGVRGTVQPQPPQPHHNYVMGVDWGRVHDFTVLVVIDEGTRQMVALDRFNQVDWELQRGRLATLANLYKPRVILAESNSIGEPNIEILQKQGYKIKPFQTTQASKAQVIDGLALAIEQGRLSLLDDPVLLNELMSYEMERTTGGQFRYSAPQGGHDDTVIALALAWEACNSKPAQLTNMPRTGGQERDLRHELSFRQRTR